MHRVLVTAGLVCVLAIVGSAQRAQQATPAASGPDAAPQRPPVLNAASTNGFEQIVKPFLAENCFPCHGDKKHKKDLNFQAITSVTSLIDDRDRWEDVVLKLRNREMPPDDEPQPPEHQRQAVAAWVARELGRIDRLTPPDPGHVTAARNSTTPSGIYSASTCIPPTTFRRTIRATASTTLETCYRCRPR
jgi:mono/diheme cytochrome c family protein